MVVPQTEAAWVEWAAGKTVRQLELQAQRRVAGQLPTDPEGRRIHETRFDIKATVGAFEWEAWSTARAKLEAEQGRSVNDREMLVEAARLLLATQPDGSVKGRTPANASHFTVHVHCCAACGEAAVEVEGERVPLDDASGREALAMAGWGGSEAAASGAAATGQSEPPREVPTADRACPPKKNGTVVSEGERDVPTPEPLRRAILGRDGHRCVVCGSRRNLTAHHILWRSCGGRTEASNMATTCEACHSLIHDNLLVLEGVVGALRVTDRRGRERKARGEAERVSDAVSRVAEPGAGAEPCARAHSERVTTGDRAVGPDGAAAEAPSGRDGKTDSNPVGATGGGPAAGGTGRAPQSSPRRLRFRDVPAEVDAAWWARHAHLLRWNEKTRGLEFEPGFPREGDGEDRPGLVAQPPPCARAHRPQRFADVIGQSGVVARLRSAVDGAKALGEPLAHVLLSGPPGVGKTTLAHAITTELGARLHQAIGPMLRDPGTILRLLAGVSPGDVVFVDEVHRLREAVAEVLYEALEDGRLSLTVRCESDERTLALRLPHFTLVGATTEDELLPEPMRQRFPIREDLELYGVDDLCR